MGRRITSKGRFFLCPTPIGNLRDVTLRVLDTLKEVDVVAAENMRRARFLLEKYDIQKPVMSYREENRVSASKKIIELIENGSDVALVSDAGTPGISDPGYHLVLECIENGIDVVSLPGPNAVICALTSSGLPTRRFAFEGFPPRREGERRRWLQKISHEERTLVFYESPRRLERTLVEMAEMFGSRKIAVGRELTKIHEEVIRGEITEVLQKIEESPPRGEIVIVVEGAKPRSGVSMEEAVKEVKLLRSQGVSLKEAVSVVSEKNPGLSRNELYNLAIKDKD
ncbi:MAG: 16S rRNA (cytidine(1402)-2'-O)-methyltransferase [Actinomycetota bacterium]|nr:16S rRNA (cytidine(1402)-2'-O)-methyltransferase [Actinomycetota bacterium]